ncbi:hypothetical protein [Symmachiella dynata]|nr:hypothetical protein [Symmachiella dynata]
MNLATKIFPRFDPFGDRCPSCGKCALREYPIHTNPPVNWSLWDCLKCGGEFVKEGGRTIPRKEYDGPLLAEFFFSVREQPDVDPNELWRQLELERNQHEKGDGN